MKVSEFHKRLRDRGCVPVRSSGGHQTWRAPNGNQFTTTVPGRKKEVSRLISQQAARALGIPPQELR